MFDNQHGRLANAKVPQIQKVCGAVKNKPPTFHRRRRSTGESWSNLCFMQIQNFPTIFHQLLPPTKWCAWGSAALYLFWFSTMARKRGGEKFISWKNRWWRAIWIKLNWPNVDFYGQLVGHLLGRLDGVWRFFLECDGWPAAGDVWFLDFRDMPKLDVCCGKQCTGNSLANGGLF